MIEIIKYNCEYVLKKEDCEFFLYVLCGTSSLYQVKVRLVGDAEKKAISDDKYLSDLSEAVRNSPESYKEKTVSK
jgi:hypothetical protein